MSQKHDLVSSRLIIQARPKFIRFKNLQMYFNKNRENTKIPNLNSSLICALSIYLNCQL